MFNYSIDSKPEITDAKGNKIIDLAKSIFAKTAGTILSYTIKKMAAHAVMRPDIVSLAEYGNTANAEYILKYTGISNPFTLDEEDILMIPDDLEAMQAMAVSQYEDESNEQTAHEAAVRNYFKFVNQDYKSDPTSYNALEAKEYKSAIPEDNFSGDYVVPYIGDDRMAINIRNGRIFFGEDAGITADTMVTASTTNLDEKILKLIDSTATALSDSNCLYNGVTLANFVKALSQVNQSTLTAAKIEEDLNNLYYEKMNSELSNSGN